MNSVLVYWQQNSVILGESVIQFTFKSTKPNGWTLIIPLIASVALIVAGNRWQEQLSSVSEGIGRLMWPIQKTADFPTHVMAYTNTFFSERVSLLLENTQLKKQQIYLQAQIQKLRTLEAENQELHELLQSIGKEEREEFSQARLIRADLDPFSQQILLNKGKSHRVEVGQPVIDAYGLVGIVLGVSQNTARVLLLTDTEFAVPVQSVRSGERAIAMGSGAGGELRLNYVPRTADFVEGDQLVTSGLGGRFPAGYPVGLITSIQHDASTRFSVIGISPSAKLGQLRHVLLVKQQIAKKQAMADAR